MTAMGANHVGGIISLDQRDLAALVAKPQDWGTATYTVQYDQCNQHL